MTDPELYLKITSLIKTKDDFETLEAFLYNSGKLVFDKRDLFEKYDSGTIKKLKDVYESPSRR